jgi:acetate kinase
MDVIDRSRMRTLVVNAGSSTLKLGVVEDGEAIWSREVPREETPRELGGLRDQLDEVGGVEAVGHRIVHGGTRFTGPTVIDADVRAALGELVDLAPLHQPKSLEAVDAVTEVLPQVPAVACFDTAFHADMPPAAATYALPAEWRQRWGLRRFGFHGLSHAYAARRAAELLDRPLTELRLVTCHLGAGASVTAVAEGRSVDTTMGFTPLEGLVMATRSGSVDPGLVLWLLERTGLTEHEVAAALEHDSGMLALAGTADMREILDRAGAGDAVAAVALDVYLHRLRAAIASMAAALQGLDALVFTGGVGERAPHVRSAACGGLGFLGVAIDPAANASGEPDIDISAEDSSAATLVIHSREDLEIARQVESVLSAGD